MSRSISKKDVERKHLYSRSTSIMLSCVPLNLDLALCSSLSTTLLQHDTHRRAIKLPLLFTPLLQSDQHDPRASYSQSCVSTPSLGHASMHTDRPTKDTTWLRPVRRQRAGWIAAYSLTWLRRRQVVALFAHARGVGVYFYVLYAGCSR